MRHKIKRQRVREDRNWERNASRTLGMNLQIGPGIKTTTQENALGLTFD